MKKPLLVVAFASTIFAGVLAGCSFITPATAPAIEAADAVACSALSLIPTVGAVVAAACAGEEAALAAALAKVIAAQADAGAPALAKADTTKPLTAAVFQRRAGKRVHLGYVSASLAPLVQAELDRSST